MQMSRALAQYGATGQVGQIVAITLVRELGPVLTAVLVAGRNASGIASELGSMKVTEQIDAMRALGTDPIQKLVTPRMIATCVMLPLLTIIADFVGIFGGYLIALVLGLHTSQYWTSAYQALAIQRYRPGSSEALRLRFCDLAGGLFLWPANQRRHARRRPRHHHGRGGLHRVDLRHHACSPASS